MDSLFTFLLMIPANVGFFLAVIGMIPFLKVLGGWQPRGAKDVAFVAVPFIIGAIGIMSAMSHLALPQS